MGRSHILTGVISGAAVANAADLDPAKSVAFVAITAVCALLPDLDHPGSTLSRKLWIPGRAFASIIEHVFGHRQITHSVLGVGLLMAGLAFAPHLPAHCYWAVILGCATHIVGDMLTVSGVPLLWPVPQKFRLFNMPTGGNLETFAVTPILTVGALWSVGVLVAAHA
jgi:inner membrane protein